MMKQSKTLDLSIAPPATRQARGWLGSLKPVDIAAYAVVIAVMLATLLPLYWMVITAFKPFIEIKSSPPTFWPSVWTLENFTQALGPEYKGAPAIADSVIVTLGTFLLSMLVGVPAAYSIARYRTGGEQLSFFILSQRFMPPIVPVIAIYLIAGKIKLLDSYLLLILVNSLGIIPFVVWIMKGFFEEIPIEIEEAAQVDGASWFQLFWHQVLPLAAPGLVAVSLFCIIFTWNEYLYATILTGRDVQPFTRIIPGFSKDHNQPHWGAISAMGLLVIVPILVVAWHLQKYIVRGLTYGAVRE
jgi:multiple sugar transport system permease protein